MIGCNDHMGMMGTILHIAIISNTLGVRTYLVGDLYSILLLGM